MSDKTKLTQAIVKALQPIPGKAQADIWDAEQPGFGVRIGSSGIKTFFVMSRVNGRLVRATVGKFPTLNVDEARKKAKRHLIEMEDGKNPNDDKKVRRSGTLTLGGIFESFLTTRKDRRQELTERTQEFYETVFKNHLSIWKSRHVSEISKPMVHELHSKIGVEKGKNAANGAIRLLRRLMNYSRSIYDLPAKNPVDGVEWFKDGRRSVVIKSPDMPKWYATVDAMQNETMRDYLFLVLFTGLRRNEAMKLTWDNVDFENKALFIPTTKNGEPHSLPLSSFLFKLLSDRHERWGEPLGYVFPSWSKKGHLTNVQHGMKILNGAGFAYTLHDLRRTFITTAESLDISVWAVKRLANHKQTDVTGQHYIVHDIDRLREPMERISTAILEMAKDKKGKVLEMKKAA